MLNLFPRKGRSKLDEEDRLLYDYLLTSRLLKLISSVRKGLSFVNIIFCG